MVLPSLRAYLLALWVLLLASAAATAYLLYEFYAQSAAVQVAETALQAARACREIGDRYAAAAGRNGAAGEAELRGRLPELVAVALARAPGVEGGIWTGAGSAAYAFPTYEGTGPKTDLPAAEADTIARLNAETARTGRPAALRRAARTQTLVLQACPLRGPIPEATAWTMARVHTDGGPAYRQLLAGFGFLAAAVLGSALFLGGLLVMLARRIARLEAQLAETRREAPEGGGDLPRLRPTGLRELDRLVEALNAAGSRLAAAHRRAAAAERLAAVGRLTAGLAHEIRNPLAAMRLKAENALASPDAARPRAALGLVLDQVARLDRLLRDLLSLTQPQPAAMAPTDVVALLAGCADLHEDLAGARGIRIETRVVGLAGRPLLDEARLRRALDNLLLNAIQNSPEGGHIRLSAAREGAPEEARLRIRVGDEGPGVPEALRARLFEPFATGRPDGTGLGLAIAREIARAHEGTLRLAESEAGTGSGATFELDLPWRTS